MASKPTREGHHKFTVNGNEFTVPDNYSLIKPIGHGAYGVVCSANDSKSGEKVAIKKVPRAFEDLVDAKRILREIKLLRHFKHENIVSLLDILTPADVHDFEDVYFVCDLMETDLHRITYSRQQLTDEHIQYFVYQILRGLKYMHSAGVLHRDLKPSNLLLNANCDLKICDFGLARGFSVEDNTDLTEYVVTRWYRAPEIMLSVQQYEKKIDMWSVGCIFAELLGRKPLFPGDDYLHQLQIICDIVGTPGDEELGFVTSEKARRFMKSQAFKKKVDLKTLYKDATDESLDLLERMLAFDPGRRISVEEALKHPYMAPLHNEEDEPVAEELFSFDFEQCELDKEALQSFIWNEMQAYHPEVQKVSVPSPPTAGSTKS